MAEREIGFSLTVRDDGSVVIKNFADGIESQVKKLQSLAESATSRVNALGDAVDRINSPLTRWGFALQSINAGLEVAGKAVTLFIGTLKLGIDTVHAFESALFRLGKEVTARTEDFEKFSAILGASVGTERGSVIAQITREIADLSPLLETQVRQIVQSLALIPSIGVQLQTLPLAKVREEIKSTVEAIQGLSVFRPDQGPQGALYAFREFLQGDTKSLEMRFDIGLQNMLPLFNSNTEKLRSSVAERRRVFEELSKSLVPPETQRELSTLPTLLVQGIEEQFQNFAVRIGQSGFYARIKDLLNTTFEAVKEATTSTDGPWADLAKTASDVLLRVLETRLVRFEMFANKILNLFVTPGQQTLSILDKVAIVLEKVLLQVEQVVNVIDEGLMEIVESTLKSAPQWVPLLKEGMEYMVKLVKLLTEAITKLWEVMKFALDNPKLSLLLGGAGIAGAGAAYAGVGAAAGAFGSTLTPLLGGAAGAAFTGAGATGAAAIAPIVVATLAVLGAGAAGVALGTLIRKTLEDYVDNKRTQNDQRVEEALVKISTGFGDSSQMAVSADILKRLEGLVKMEQKFPGVFAEAQGEFVPGFSGRMSNRLNGLGDVDLPGMSREAQIYTQRLEAVARDIGVSPQDILEMGGAGYFRNKLRVNRASAPAGVGAIGPDEEEESINQAIEANQRALRRIAELSSVQTLLISNLNTSLNAAVIGDAGGMVRGRGGNRNQTFEDSFVTALRGYEQVLQDFRSTVGASVTTKGGFDIPEETTIDILRAGEATARLTLALASDTFFDSFSTTLRRVSGPQELQAIVRNSQVVGLLGDGRFGVSTSDVEALVNSISVQKDPFSTSTQRTAGAIGEAELRARISKALVTRVQQEISSGSLSGNSLTEAREQLREGQAKLASAQDNLIKVNIEATNVLLQNVQGMISAIQSLSGISNSQSFAGLNVATSRSLAQLGRLERNGAGDLSDLRRTVDQLGGLSAQRLQFDRAGFIREGDSSTPREEMGDAETRRGFLKEEIEAIGQAVASVEQKKNSLLDQQAEQRKKLATASGMEAAAISKSLGLTEVQLDKLEQIAQAEEDLQGSLQERLELQEKIIEKLDYENKVRNDPRYSLSAGVKDALGDISRDNPFRDFAKQGTMDLRDALRDSIVDGIRSGGKNAEQIWNNFLNTIEQAFLNSIAQILANAALSGLIGVAANLGTSLFGASAGGAGGGLTTLGNSTAGLNVAARGNIFGGSFMPLGMSVGRFSEGGVAGRPTIGLIAEAGFPEAMIPMYDRRSIEVRMDPNGQMYVPLPSGKNIPARMNYQGYATGGVADDSGASPLPGPSVSSSSSNTKRDGRISQTIVNSIDPTYIRQVMVQSSDVILNVIGQNARTVRQSIGIPS